MGMWQFQSVLNRGEIDPLAVGRIDLQQYYNGVETALNMVAIPQGGLKKRPGQEHLNTVLAASSIIEGRLENFSFNIDLSYLLVFTGGRMQIYKDDVLQTNINGSGFDFLATPWNSAQTLSMDYIQSADTAVVTHPDVAPQSIVRTSDTAWTISATVITNIPQYDFNDLSSPPATAQKQTLTFVNANDGDRFKLALNGILTEEIIYSSTTEGRVSMGNSIVDELTALPNTPEKLITTNTTAPGNVNLVFTSDAANDWDAITGTPVVSQVATFEVTGTITQAGTPSTEDVWSATRGWPRACTFHEGRLWFGGSKSLPQTIWGSFVNDFFNFKTRKGLDDESISATLDTDQINTIQGIFSNRSLQIFTGGAEFYVRESPITPENIAVTPQTNYGSKRVRPVTIDGVTLFVQRTGKALMQFVYRDEFQSNQSTSVSMLAPHLIKDPTKLAISLGTESSDANYVYILNSDGTMTVFNTLSAQEVAGFTRWESGDIKSVAVVDDKVYVLILRGEPGGYRLDLEVENGDLNTDGAVVATGSGLTTVTGLDHLEGETVKVKADGYVQTDKVVSSGEITLDYPADSVEVGLEFLPVIKLLPLNVNLKSGPNASSKKKIMRASVQIFESNGVIINGQRIADKVIGLNQFDAPTPQTGLRRIFLSGWSLEAQITITQDTPMPMTILNVGMEVKV